MRRQLTELRNKMKQEGIDIYIIPSSDWHGSEYVNDYFKCREYISGFTGSAGTLVVEQDCAKLWTDGRYFIQASQQLAGSGIELMKLGEEGIPTVEAYLESLHAGMSGSTVSDDIVSKEIVSKRIVLGFDGSVVHQETGQRLEERFTVRYEKDLAGEIWEDRPQLVPSRIREISMDVTGESAESKLQRLRTAMGDADYILLSSLEEIAWLYNLRGADIAYTPVFYSFALVSKAQDVLYVMDGALHTDTVSENDAETNMKAGILKDVCIKKYGEIHQELAALRNCTVMLDKRTVSYAISKCFDSSVKIIMEDSPVALFKAIKNEREIAATKNAHIRDGAAVTEFIYWLKHTVAGEGGDAGRGCVDDPKAADHLGFSGRDSLTERSAAAYLANCRKKHGAYDLSFEAIAGYEAHGAIVHYAATEETDAVVKQEGFLLVDSGGQYYDGTTDITRTIALGPVSEDRRKNYTAVLKGHIALALARFDDNTTGAELDAMARKPLQERGLDYNHGTGHGVGHLLSVHEGPNTISRRGTDSHILPGMITSDEPGVYLEGEYGIRIENEILCITKEDDVRSEGAAGAAPKYAFEAITLCPYERDAIEIDMLTKQEIDYIDDYHRNVCTTLKGHLPDEIGKWLEQVCRPICQGDHRKKNRKE